jgi:hypothetical protein
MRIRPSTTTILNSEKALVCQGNHVFDVKKLFLSFFYHAPMSRFVCLRHGVNATFAPEIQLTIVSVTIYINRDIIQHTLYTKSS